MIMVVYTALGTVVAVRAEGAETIMCQKMFLRNKAF
jgi:hypothetical protein